MSGAILFHVEQVKWREIAELFDSPFDENQLELLVMFRDWLASEAEPAGGLGPHELSRLDRRHITDSLLFSKFLPIDTDEVTDLGSGVGLPGIPLAILRPHTRFRLIDRSQRKVDLLKRVVRVLDLSNVELVETDATRLQGDIGFIVSRATLPPDKAFHLFDRLLSTSGTAVLGGSWTEEPRYSGWETVDVGGEVLDQPVWLLIMRR